MTINIQDKTATGNGNGSATLFSFSPLVIFAVGDIKLFSTVDATGVETEISRGTGASAFAVVVSSYPGTGSVRYPEDEVTPIATGITLTMKRVLTIEQTLDLNPQGRYDAQLQERQFDKITAILLQLEETLSRAVTIPVSASGVTMELPAPAALEFWRWNAAADQIETAALTALAASGSATPVAVSLTAGVVGVSSDYSREDHAHLLPRAHMPKGGDLASASPLVIDTDGNYFDVTGTTGFAAMTVVADLFFMLQFDGILMLTHHATNLNLPGGADITTAAGDRMLCYSTAANTVHVLAFMRAGGMVKGGDIASASPLVIGTDGSYFDVTGTTGFSTMTVAIGRFFILQFDGALTMTDGASIDLGGANITTAAGDRAIFYATAANVVQLLTYQREGAPPLLYATQAEQETGTATNVAVSPGRQHFHASACKVWGNVDRSAGTPSLQAGAFNVASVADDGAANTAVTIGTDFSDALYSVSVQPFGFNGNRIANVHSEATGAFDVVVKQDEATADDTHDFTFSAFGDHA